MQRIVSAGSQLLSDDHVTSWRDLTTADQRQSVGHLLVAVETSSFARARLSQSPTSILVDHRNIGIGA